MCMFSVFLPACTGCAQWQLRLQELKVCSVAMLVFMSNLVLVLTILVLTFLVSNAEAQTFWM